jgi:hypothetical protein
VELPALARVEREASGAILRCQLAAAAFAAPGARVHHERRALRRAAGVYGGPVRAMRVRDAQGGRAEAAAAFAAPGARVHHGRLALRRAAGVYGGPVRAVRVRDVNPRDYEDGHLLAPVAAQSGQSFAP